MLAPLLVASSVLLADPTWLEGPVVVPAAPARNPALASGGGRVHAVFRRREGGLGYMVAGTGEPFAGASVIAGAEAAASKGNKNYPAIAVDAAGVAHVAWAPGSAPGNGAYYVRVGSDGVPLAAATKISARWVESLAVAVDASEVHVLLTAIKQEGEPEGADGVFDLHGPLAGGPLAETEAWQFPNFAELAATPSPDGGLALVARWDVIKRLDRAQGQWGNFKNVEVPAGSTSVGRPQLAFAGDVLLWGAIGWVEAAPTSVEVRAGGPKQPWTALASGELFDPDTADGEPAVALAAGPAGERAVAWLAASAPRLRVSVGTGDWGQPVALPDTDDATSFALVGEGEGYRVVFVGADGTLWAGRIGAPVEGETTGEAPGASSGAGSSGEPSGSSGEASSAGSSGAPPGATTSTGDATSATSGPATDGPATSGPSASTDAATGGEPGGEGCGCRSEAELSLGACSMLLLRRRRRADDRA